MFRYLLSTIIVCFAITVHAGELKDGDIIFQITSGGQSKAIQLATKSEYTHCGIIYKEGNETYVYEAVQPVRRIPLKQWIAQGNDGHYVVKRLKNATTVLTPDAVKKMKQTAQNFTGKDYDLAFGWSDENIYCSELVWKVYERGANIEVSKPQKLKEFDLTHPIVKAKLKERYGNNIPLDETVVSPAAIFNSELLTTVESN